MLGLICRNRWLTPRHVAASYDRLAPGYDDAWLVHLRPVTEDLLTRLPDTLPPGAILDLGCGTGCSTAALAARYPGRAITGLDISAGMLTQARRRCAAPGLEFVQGDLLAGLRGRQDASAALVFSAWAIGYSDPVRVVREAGRVLVPGGTLAFVVNRLDTLGPVFRAFRRCLHRFPHEARLALWPRFPRSWAALAPAVGAAGLDVPWHTEASFTVPPMDGRERSLAWLLSTGILAGFDAVLPLATPGPVAEFFEQELRADPAPIAHCYLAALCHRPAHPSAPGATEHSGS